MQIFQRGTTKLFLLQISTGKFLSGDNAQSTKLGIALPQKFFSVSYWVRICLGLERRLFMSIKWAFCFLGALRTPLTAGYEQPVYF